MNIIICNTCSEPHYKSESICPHCNGVRSTSTASKTAILLGLGLVGCSISAEPVYGVPMDSAEMIIDEDGDGYDSSVDCDDTDSEINPGAEETVEDGIDSNCNNEDDT